MKLIRLPVNLRVWRYQHKKRYSEEQTIKAIKEHEAGVKVDDICRTLGISSGTLFNWRSKYADVKLTKLSIRGMLENENSELKKLLAEKLLENEAMEDVLTKKR